MSHDDKHGEGATPRTDAALARMQSLPPVKVRGELIALCREIERDGNYWAGQAIDLEAPLPSLVAPMPMVRKWIELFASWEDKNGAMAGILDHEWADLKEPVSDLACYASPRNARTELNASAPSPLAAPTPMPVSRYRAHGEGHENLSGVSMKADKKGEWVAYGDYEALEKLYIEQTGCCSAPSHTVQTDRDVSLAAHFVRHAALAALVQECLDGVVGDCTEWNARARKLLAEGGQSALSATQRILPPDFLLKKEWSMGNGQCPECCGVPASWHGHPLHMTTATIGHEKNCSLAAALVAVGDTPLMKGAFKSETEFEHYISEGGLFGTRPKTAEGCPRYKEWSAKLAREYLSVLP